MFENKYKKAYDAIVPSQELVEKLIGQARAGKLERKKVGLCLRQPLLLRQL